ncbi:MAG: hypothetical protein HS105_02180 [Chloracidobacterium sp.]|nr:hypothetical protein [Chloracidobacterium sp.]MCC6824145.1 hypothetical protein [Acidobacteriota bacterium]MCO5333851.1 YCF48-related protein [Pyrinomonadaceae bacterium]
MRRPGFILSVLAVIVAASATLHAEWVRYKSASFAWLRDIAFVSETKGFIVGTDGVMLTTGDGGETWTQVPKFTTDTFRQIHFTDAKTGWLLCERNTYSRGQNATSYLRKTVDGGATWDRIEFEGAGRERVTKLIFNKYGWGTAFGEGGYFYKLQEDGRTWKQSKTAIHFLLMSGAYGEGRNGLIVGAGGTILFSEDSGLMWDKATLLGDLNAKYNAVYCVGERNGWAVGTGGAIVAATGGGRLWRVQRSGVTADLNDVIFLDRRRGWAVGDDGTIIATQDGGKTWTEENSRVKYRLEKIAFRGGRGWIVGFGGTILSTEGPAAGERPAITRQP